MRINVISLKSATTRREHIRKQFEQLGVDFSFFDAVEPGAACKAIDGYNEREFVINCGRVATDTEIACYASHLEMWRRIAAGDEPQLVLEDDANLEPGFAPGLLVAFSKARRLGFVRISLPTVRTSNRMEDIGSFEIHMCRRAPLLALGYILSPSVAGRLVKVGSIVEEPVDKFMQRYWRFGNPVYALVPNIVGLSEHAAESHIGARSRSRVDLAMWLNRAGRKTENAVRRTLFSARTLSDPSFREVPPAVRQTA